MRVLCATTANDGHFGPLLPFARAFRDAGHEVRVAAPLSYQAAITRAALPHQPFGDPPPEVIGPIMARLPSMTFEQANDAVVQEVFGRVDAQAALPALLMTFEAWRPDVVLRESAELASLAAAERFGVPHVQVYVGMSEVAARFREALADPLEELARHAGIAEHQLPAALDAEPVLSLVPELLDYPSGLRPREDPTVYRFHQPTADPSRPRTSDWGDLDRPLLYVTFGSVAGSLPPFTGIFQEALDALANLDISLVMTTGRTLDGSALSVPTNARILPWLPQESILAHATAMLGHGGFGTSMGALAAGVPQMVVPLFAFDQVVNGAHIASIGAGLTVDPGPAALGRAAAEIPHLMQTPTYAQSAQRVATAMQELPPPAGAVPLLTDLVS